LKKAPSCLDGTDIRQNMVGLKIANFFHPEMFGVVCRNHRTPIDLFESDELFRKTVLKWVRVGDGLRPSDLRRMLAGMSGTQKVSNFRPTAAIAVYEYFKPSLTVDFSAGWGGRMLGAMASKTPYIGIDPSTYSVTGNRKMLNAIEGDFDVTLIQNCAEDLLGKNLWEPDLIFTSPPYFNVEKYSDEETQSYLRYPERDLWFRDFLAVAIKGAFIDLKEGGHLVLNINPDMVSKSREAAVSAGFTELPSWALLLSRMQFNRKYGDQFRREPILIFRKGEGKKKMSGKIDILSLFKE
jgi:hypothetical protein